MRKESIVIRKFEEEDAAAIAELIKETLSISNSRDYSPEIIKNLKSKYSEDSIRQTGESCSIFVAVSNAVGIVGTIGLKESTVFGLFVKPSWQKKGLGKKLLKFIERYAKQCGYSKLRLASSITAYGFYKRNGFIPVKNEVNEKYGEVIIMEKSLDSE